MTRRSARLPAVAGTFYPAGQEALRDAVKGYLDTAAQRAGAPGAERLAPVGAPPKAIIAPHAGYVYSGPIAASAYSLLSPIREIVRRVVLLGPSHRAYVQGLAASSADVFVTPLGEVPIDRQAVDRSLELPQVSLLDEAHSREHSLEVQIPFLQLTLREFSLVPFSVGEATTDEVCEVLELLWNGDETLIVISSDLSHYYDYETARRLDAATSQAIEALRPEALDSESACGRVPVRGLLRAARQRGLSARTVDLRNSGDTAGPRDQVVGYGSYIIS